MRSGAKSTEFYLTTVKALIGPTLAILATTGVLAPEATTDLQAALNQAAAGIISVVGLVMSGKAVTKYTEARTQAKITAEQTIQVTAAAGSQQLPEQIGFSMQQDDIEWEIDEDEARA